MSVAELKGCGTFEMLTRFVGVHDLHSRAPGSLSAWQARGAISAADAAALMLLEAYRLGSAS